MCSRRDSRCIFPRKKARLQLADPVPATRHRQLRLTLQMLLEATFVELGIVEGSEVRSVSTQGFDEPDLGDDAVYEEAEARLTCKLKSGFGLALHVDKRVPAGDKVGDQVIAAIGGKSQITQLVC